MSDSMTLKVRNEASPDSAPDVSRAGVLRILIAEDHNILSEGLRALLMNEPGMEVVGIAENGLEAVASATRLVPDLVLMDLSMPEMDGLSAIREIARCKIPTKILVLTAHKTEEHIRAALQAGAHGYALKDSPQVELLIAIRRVVSGKIYISPQVSGCIVEVQQEDSLRPVFLAASETLTERESQVLRCVVKGSRNREIAQNLGISIKTVEKHRASVMRKLKLANAADLIAFACENGLLESV